MRLSAKQVDNCYNEALLAFVYCRYQGMYLYLSHTNVIILLLHRCSEKLKNAYMRPYSMPGTYRKRIHMSLVHTDSFRQTPICAHSTLRVKNESKANKDI